MENPDRVTYFAATDSRGRRVPFGIKTKDRERHMYVIGKTGMGKSTLLENLAIQDIRNGEGMAFIDPHGSAVEKLLEYIPEERKKDVVYFAPFDLAHPIAFNVMEDVGYDKRHLVVSGLMATFKKIWVDAWSARMEYILSNTLLALEYPGATLLGVNRMYTDKAYRKKVVENVKDPVVKDFWTKEFANYTDRFTQEATPAIQNKVGQFTSNPLIRNIIGQPESSFDIRKLMDERKILLVNLSKGLVGDTNMKLLGSMITTRIFLAAMSRANLPHSELKKAPKFYFYVDEFQNFANETFAEILSEARKYQLNLVIAHQYVEQMEEEVRAAVFGNVGTTVAFRVGPFDAEVLETVFNPEFTKEDLVNLGFAQIYLTLMIDGIGSRPFSAVTIPPIEPPPVSHRDEVIKLSQEQFGNPREGIEEAIYAELAEAAASAEAEPPRPKPSFQRPPPQRAQAPLRSAPPQRSLPPHRAEDELPSPRRENPRPPAPQPQQVRPVPPPSRSSDDLKAILRTMTAGAAQQKEVKVQQKQEGLKGALADVLEKGRQGADSSTQPERRAVANPAPQAKPAAPQAAQQRPAALPPQPSVQPVQAASAPIPAPAAADKPKPFEVPEDQLRAIFKENL
jgi:hypothetical protein